MDKTAQITAVVPDEQHQNQAGSSVLERENWSKKLLPLMGWMLIGLTLFFFIASAIQLAYLHVEIGKAPQPDLEMPMALLQGSGDEEAGNGERQNAAIAVLSALELSAMRFRYHQANVALLSRVWTRYLGFVTGMVLAMVGAAFVLGRLQDQGSEATAKSSAGSFTFKTASPGLIMATLGVAMMITTITTHHEIAVTDQAIFVGGLRMSGGGNEGIAKPLSLRNGSGSMEAPSESAGVPSNPELDDLFGGNGGNGAGVTR
ncbi:hypothetical protein [Pelagibius sp. Alg239-R121]|uniref:hypothetical protein n=1 Tax=Pelagibius sp. Alg239-R121 TaxID=2993448 RepID=UPI0024A78D21|nr:hypothetical protein [Pelagibius sp. Alg239-R121]